MKIPYGRQTIEQDDIDAVSRVLEGDWLTQGPEVRGFEQDLAEACGAPYAVAFSSGTAALHGAAFAAGLGPGDDLLTSALTFAASANCGAYLGATPRFADIGPATWNVSAATVSAAITDSTRAVVPVHFAGLPAPVADIRAAVGEDVVIIEDAAHAIGAMDDGQPVGSCVHSDMAAFSFHPVKTIATGEGGAVTTRDPELRRRLTEFRNHGFASTTAAHSAPEDGGWYREQQALGLNYRLSDIHSALGRSQLRKLERFVEARGAVADRYREQLDGLDGLELPPAAPEGSRHAYHLFVIRVRAGAETRRRVYDGLHERGVLAQVHYMPVYLHPWYRETYGYGPGLCPAAEEYYAGALSLPCFPALTTEDQDRVVGAVRELVAD